DEPVPLPRPSAVVLQPAGAAAARQGTSRRRRRRADRIDRHRARRGRSVSDVVGNFVIPVIKIAIVLNATLVAVTYMVLLERKVIAWAQSRLGPMRVGAYGVLEAVADAIRLSIRVTITLIRAYRLLFTAAPIISMVPALIVYAVIPFGPKIHLFGREVSLFITDINVGLLYVVSVASVGVYGIILAGYASNSKYP